MASDESTRYVHVCYAGTSGASRVALDIARGSAYPKRHGFVLFGVEEPKPEYVSLIESLGCAWTAVSKKRGVDVGSYPNAAQAAMDLQPRVVFLHGARLAPVAFWSGYKMPEVPRIGVHHGQPDVATTSMRQVSTLMGWLCDGHVAVSNALARAIESHAVLKRACPDFWLIENGVDLDFWKCDAPDFAAPPPWRIAMVGTLNEHKDQATLLKAVGQLVEQGNDLSLDLVGGGPEREGLEKLAAELKLTDRTVFHGDQPREKVRDVVRGARILAHASRNESFGLAVAEGMAAQRAVVASDIPALRDLVEHDVSGLLAAAGDVHAWALALGRLINDPRLCERLAQQARDTVVQRLDLQRTALSYETLAEQLIAKADARP